MSRDGRLFAEGDLSATLRAEQGKLAAAAGAIPAADVLATSVEALADELVKRFRVEPLDVHWDEANVALADVQIDVSRDPMRMIFDRDRPFYVPGTKFTYQVPFTGDATLFRLQPSHFTLSPPTGTIKDNELRIELEQPAPLDDTIRTDFDRAKAQIKNYVDWINQDVSRYNESLPVSARSAAEQRRSKVVADRDMLASLGVPVRRKEDAAPTYAVPPV